MKTYCVCIAFPTEARYGVYELELLGVVWSIEFFKEYLHGQEFTLVTNHGSILKNQYYQYLKKLFKKSSTKVKFSDGLIDYIFAILP